MADREVRIPGPDHPITIAPYPGRVVVTVAGRTIADTRAALRLQEAAYPPVLYIPRADADMAVLERGAHTSWCPYKGEAAYFGVPAGGARAADAVWSYEAPHEAVGAIRGHLAFYPDRVDAIEIGAA